MKEKSIIFCLEIYIHFYSYGSQFGVYILFSVICFMFTIEHIHRFIDKNFTKELGPRMANMALSICLKMKMIEKVLKSDYSTNESLLILCLWL